MPDPKETFLLALDDYIDARIKRARQAQVAGGTITSMADEKETLKKALDVLMETK